MARRKHEVRLYPVLAGKWWVQGNDVVNSNHFLSFLIPNCMSGDFELHCLHLE